MSHHYPGISHLQQIISEQHQTLFEFLSQGDTPETDHKTALLFLSILSGLEV